VLTYGVHILLRPPLKELADSLANARCNGSTIELVEPPHSLEEAYQVQEEVAQLIGGDSIGWKVGSTSAQAQARLGTTEPGAGRLLQKFVFGDGAMVPIYPAHDVQVEVEFAFRFGTTLPPRAAAYERTEVVDALDAFVPAMEIVGSRYHTGLGGAGRELVTADGGANIAFVGGAAKALPKGFDWAAQPCELTINGTPVAHGSGARALDDPMNVLVWLANHLSARGISLDANSTVSTGTCTGLVAIAPGDELLATFGHLGQVRATLTSAP
jgi:2-keto-4-pentenoate hydratase